LAFDVPKGPQNILFQEDQFQEVLMFGRPRLCVPSSTT